MKTRTHKYLHKPFRLLWFESDEIFLLFAGLVLGMYVNTLFFLVLIVCAVLSRKFKAKYPRGFVRHISYFLGLLRFKKYPSFFESSFQE